MKNIALTFLVFSIFVLGVCSMEKKARAETVYPEPTISKSNAEPEFQFRPGYPAPINWACSLAVCFAYRTDTGEILSIKKWAGKGGEIAVGAKP